jgi:hypothetical protein
MTAQWHSCNPKSVTVTDAPFLKVANLYTNVGILQYKSGFWYTNTVKPGYNDISSCDTLSKASDILWHQLIRQFDVGRSVHHHTIQIN